MMPYDLKYKVANASLATVVQPTQVNGEDATISFLQAAIDLVPVEHSGGTISLALPTAAVSDFPVNATVTISVSVDAPAIPTTENMGA
jgi:hypothetical protein